MQHAHAEAYGIESSLLAGYFKRSVKFFSSAEGELPGIAFSVQFFGRKCRWYGHIDRLDEVDRMFRDRDAPFQEMYETPAKNSVFTGEPGIFPLFCSYASISMLLCRCTGSASLARRRMLSISTVMEKAIAK